MPKLLTEDALKKQFTLTNQFVLSYLCKLSDPSMMPEAQLQMHCLQVASFSSSSTGFVFKQSTPSNTKFTN